MRTVRFGEPVLLQVANADAPWLVAAGRCHVPGGRPHVGVCYRVAYGARCHEAEFAREVRSGSPKANRGSFHRPQWGCSLRTAREPVFCLTQRLGRITDLKERQCRAHLPHLLRAGAIAADRRAMKATEITPLELIA